MPLSIAVVMGRGSQPDSRVRFILHRGVVPWGIIAGACAAVAATLGLRDDTAAATPASPTTVVVAAALSFVVWCAIAGWAIGAIRWEMRRRDGRGTLPPNRKRR